MTLGGNQKVDELAEHVRPDRLALVSTGLHGIVGVDAEMVRPEPYQALGKTDLGPYGAVVVGLGLAEEILHHGSFGLRLRRRRLCLRGFCLGTLGVCGFFHPGVFTHWVLHRRIISGELRGFLPCGFLCGLLALGLQLLLRCTLGNEVRRHAACGTAAHQPGIGNLAGVWLVKFGKERASWIGCDRRDGTGTRSEAESVQCKSRSPVVKGHDFVPAVDGIGSLHSQQNLAEVGDARSVRLGTSARAICSRGSSPPKWPSGPDPGTCMRRCWPLTVSAPRTIATVARSGLVSRC